MSDLATLLGQLRTIASRGKMDDADVQVLFDVADAMTPFTVSDAAGSVPALLNLADLLDREADTLKDPRSVWIWPKTREGMSEVKDIRERFKAVQCNHSEIMLRSMAKWVRGFVKLRFGVSD